MSGMTFGDFLNEPSNFGGARRLKNWRDEGEVIVWIHTPTRISRRLIHMVAYVGMKKNDAGRETKSIIYFPFVCHEDPVTFNFGRSTPEHCPLCRFVDWLQANDDIPDDEIVWNATARDRKRDRICTKSDIIGDVDAGGDWRLSFKPRLEYIMAVIRHPEKNEQPEILIANEKFSLAESIKRTARQEIDSKGPELGDPSITPYAFKWVYDGNARVKTQYYSAYRYDGAKLTPAIRELLASPPVDLSQQTAFGDSAKLREIMEQTIPEAIIDPDTLDELFNNVQPNQGTADADVEEEEPWEKEKREQSAQARGRAKQPKAAARSRTAKRKQPEPETEPETDLEPSDEVSIDETEEPEEPAPRRAAPAVRRQPPTRQAAKPTARAIEPTEETPAEEACVLCKGTGKWRGKNCIDCGGSGEAKHRIPPVKRRVARKPKEEPPPPPPPADDDDVVCGTCNKVVGADDAICPHCGAEFDPED